jgi:hypothetical protein
MGDPKNAKHQKPMSAADVGCIATTNQRSANHKFRVIKTICDSKKI